VVKSIIIVIIVIKSTIIVIIVIIVIKITIIVIIVITALKRQVVVFQGRRRGASSNNLNGPRLKRLSRRLRGRLLSRHRLGEVNKAWGRRGTSNKPVRRFVLKGRCCR
jgi:ABC-type multidrug transport system fused ATPase/permease subunit